MRELLEGRDPSPRYRRASADLRRAAFEILRDTHPDFRDR
jgi:hypothetical protein